MKLRNKKTGEIVDLSVGYIRDAHNGEFIQIKPVACLEDKGSYLYDTFAKFSEDWEDYKPAEPYIKDEKNRKVVRAWLEANDLDGATFHTSSHFFHYWNLRGFNDNGQGVDIDFFLTGEGIPNLIDGKYYTKFELCGEYEE